MIGEGADPGDGSLQVPLHVAFVERVEGACGWTEFCLRVETEFWEIGEQGIEEIHGLGTKTSGDDEGELGERRMNGLEELPTDGRIERLASAHATINQDVTDGSSIGMQFREHLSWLATDEIERTLTNL